MFGSHCPPIVREKQHCDRAAFHQCTNIAKKDFDVSEIRHVLQGVMMLLFPVRPEAFPGRAFSP